MTEVSAESSPRIETLPPAWRRLFDRILYLAVTALLSGALFVGKWALNAEARIHELEQQQAATTTTIEALRARQQAVTDVQVTVAALQATLAAQEQIQRDLNALVLRLVDLPARPLDSPQP